MKRTFHALFIISLSVLRSTYGMKHTLGASTTQKNQIQPTLWVPEEIIANIAGYCQPTEKNTLMKISKDFSTCLKIES